MTLKVWLKTNKKKIPQAAGGDARFFCCWNVTTITFTIFNQYILHIAIVI